jgi:inorganic triphosphatase YgiF
MADENLDVAALNIEAHVQRLQAIADPIARTTATDLISSVLQLHSAALERLLEIVGERSDSAAIIAALDADPLVRSILLLHDLHPQSTSERVREALRGIEGRLKKRETSVELVSLAEETLTLRLMGANGGCGAESIVEDAVRNAAPEIRDIKIETAGAARSGFVSLEMLRAGKLENATGMGG